MNYVEVIYLLKGFFESRKALYFPKDEAEKIFTLTVKQFKEEKKEALVVLRGEHHGLIKSELIQI
jgi:hypothetical protein